MDGITYPAKIEGLAVYSADESSVYYLNGIEVSNA